jgi:cytochrome c peroxidase
MTLRQWIDTVTRLTFPVRWLSRVVPLMMVGVLMGSAPPTAETPYMLRESPVVAAQEPIVPLPLHLALDAQRVTLGEQLFHDVRLSHDNTRACTTCHPLERGGMDGLPRARAANGTIVLRHTPTVFNVGFNTSFNWDGRTDTLESHAELVLLNPHLMHTTWPELLAKLRGDAAYVTHFNAAYGGSRAVTAARAAWGHEAASSQSRNSRARGGALSEGEPELLARPVSLLYRSRAATHQG